MLPVGTGVAVASPHRFDGLVCRSIQRGLHVCDINCGCRRILHDQPYIDGEDESISKKAHILDLPVGQVEERVYPDRGVRAVLYGEYRALDIFPRLWRKETRGSSVGPPNSVLRQGRRVLPPAA